MHVAPDITAAGCIAVVAVGIGILAVRSDRVVGHLAVLAVSRVAALAGCGAALRVRQRSLGLVHGVDRLGQRGDRHVGTGLRVLEGLGLQHADHVVRMALLAQHGVAAQTVIQRTTVGVVVLHELGTGTVVVHLQDGNGSGFQVGDPVAGAQTFPECLLLLVQRELVAVGGLVAVAVRAVRNVDRAGADEADRLAGVRVDHRSAGLFIHQTDPCFLERLDIGFGQGQRILHRAVVERCQRQTERIPDAGIGQHDGHVVQHGRLGVNDGAHVAGVMQIAIPHRAGNGSTCGTVVARNRDLDTDEQFFLVCAGVLGIGALQVLVYIKVVEVGVGNVLVGPIFAVTVHIVRHVPIFQLGAFGIGVVDMAISQTEAFFAVDQHARFFGVGFQQLGEFIRAGRRLDDLALHRVIRRQHAAIAEIEAGTVHTEFVIDGDVVIVLRLGSRRRSECRADHEGT